PNPSATYNSPPSIASAPGRLKPVVLSLPSVLPPLPICSRNLPFLSNFNTCASAGGGGPAAPRPRPAGCPPSGAPPPRAPAGPPPPRLAAGRPWARGPPRSAAAAAWRERRRREPAADPPVALCVHRDARRIRRPVVAATALRIPVRDEISGRVERQHLR